MSRPITVLGAGVIGLACALALQQRQFAVTLVDRADPGTGCSFGNAGMIQTGSVLPFATPAVLRQVPRMLLDSKSALILRWREVPRLLPWFAAVVGNARAERVAAGSRALESLLSKAKGAYRELADSVVRETFRPRGELYVFSGEAAFAAASAKFSVYRDHGIAFEVLNAQALAALEPALSPRYRHGYYLPDSEYVVDPLAVSKGLLQLFLQAGGKLVRGEVSRLAVVDDTKVHLTGPEFSLLCESLVLATGSATASLAKQLGLVAPIEPMRGYHVVVPKGDLELSGPVIDGEMNVAATPMSTGIRLAGTLEFAGFRAPPDWNRAAMLMPLGQRMLPGMSPQITSQWAGDRPGTPDGLPVIGRAPILANVWCAFGHGTLGLTLAAITGRLVADSVLGVASAVDLAPFGAQRFSRQTAA